MFSHINECFEEVNTWEAPAGTDTDHVKQTKNETPLICYSVLFIYAGTSRSTPTKLNCLAKVLNVKRTTKKEILDFIHTLVDRTVRPNRA